MLLINVKWFTLLLMNSAGFYLCLLSYYFQSRVISLIILTRCYSQTRGYSFCAYIMMKKTRLLFNGLFLYCSILDIWPTSAKWQNAHLIMVINEIVYWTKVITDIRFTTSYSIFWNGMGIFLYGCKCKSSIISLQFWYYCYLCHRNISFSLGRSNSRTSHVKTSWLRAYLGLRFVCGTLLAVRLADTQWALVVGGDRSLVVVDNWSLPGDL